ncbi:InlB B-repeat-containing protein [Bengtsoniella intestinalis]|uniref:InlB B-repeat-containing protein n=1 Tax=Bengtsoniella intestinalis TaxID=3073143 RepID=UPI00391F2904
MAVFAVETGTDGSWGYYAKDIDDVTDGIQYFSDGLGTESAPYEIATAQELANLSYLTNTYQLNTLDGDLPYAEAYYEITADITLNEGLSFVYQPEDTMVKATVNGSTFYIGTGYNLESDAGTYYTKSGDTYTEVPNGTSGYNYYTVEDGILKICLEGTVHYIYLWVPIGTSEYQFGGSIDGNNHVITGLYINSPTENGQGLLGYRTRLEYNSRTIENIVIDSIDSDENSTGLVLGGLYVGGLCGWQTYGYSIPIYNCVNNAIVVGQQSVAGIVGDNDLGLLLNSCVNNATIVSQRAYAGGIAGPSDETFMYNCENHGDIYGTTNIGGLIAVYYLAYIKNCINTGDVYGTTYPGGIHSTQIWGNTVTVNNCYSTGMVTSTSGGNTYAIGRNGSYFDNVFYLESTGTRVTADSETDEIPDGVFKMNADGTLDESITVGEYTCSTVSSALTAWVTNQDNSTYSTWSEEGSDGLPVLDETYDPTDVYYNVVFTYNNDIDQDYGVVVKADYNGIGVGYTQGFGFIPEPVNDGYDFAGWYSDETLETLASSSAASITVSADSHFYAKWEEEAPPVVLDSYTVNFYYDVANETADYTESVVENDTVANVPYPEQDGSIFMGWYTEKELENAWSASSAITGNLDLYPKWSVGGFNGDGTTESPYQINTIDDLQYLSYLVSNVAMDASNDNALYTTLNYELTADLSMNEGYSFAYDDTTGLVAVSYQDGVIFYIGTGCISNGITVGGTSATSVAGTYYYAIGEEYATFTTADTIPDVAGYYYEILEDCVQFYCNSTEVTNTIDTWDPIGIDLTDGRFEGVFDGQGHTVSGLFVNTPAVNGKGLFGRLYNYGVVTSVTVADSLISGQYYNGAVVGNGHGNSSIIDCTNENTIVIGSNAYNGGVVGNSNNLVENCNNQGTVISAKTYIGGIVGIGVTVTNCENNGAVYGGGYTGGVVGRGTNVSNCINAGTVTGTGSYTGGVAGYVLTTLFDCVNDGYVKGASYVAGIAGLLASYATIYNSLNQGTVTGTGSYHGGIVASAQGIIENNVNVGAVIGVNGNIGAIAGLITSMQKASNNYYLVNSAYYISGLNTIYCYGNKTTEDIVTQWTSFDAETAETVATSLNANVDASDIYENYWIASGESVALGCKVSYAVNIGAVDSEIVVQNGTATEPTLASEYTLQDSAWYTDEAQTQAYEFADAVTENITLYGTLLGQGYTVAFDANGATGTMETQTFTQGTTQALAACTFTMDEKVFLGWDTDASADEVVYYDKQAVQNITTEDTITLYAVWGETENPELVVDTYFEKVSGGFDTTADASETFSVPLNSIQLLSDFVNTYEGFTHSYGLANGVYTDSITITESGNVISNYYLRNTYTVTWKDTDDSVLATTSALYGSTPSDSRVPTPNYETAEYDYIPRMEHRYVRYGSNGSINSYSGGKSNILCDIWNKPQE